MSTLTELPSDKLRQRMPAARAALGWRQADLAERIGVSRTVITRIEGGTRDITINEGVAILWVLGIPPAEVGFS